MGVRFAPVAPFESRENRIADLLSDRYELLEQFGQGGFATVYRVKNLRLGRIEALKVLSQELTEDSDFARRFEQEARVSASLDHPNIVKIYDYGVTEGIAWFTMQFINGQSLARELNAGTGRMEEPEVIRIAVLILDALEYSHGRGVIHRDIKPDNIMMDASRRPYLADFGIAKAEDSLVKTRSGLLIGSPAYMAPEQIRGGAVDGRTDLYALAVTLYKTLSGDFPFRGDDALGLAMKKLQEAPEPLHPKRPELKAELEAAIMKALARGPAERFESASEMRDALEACIGDLGPRERLLRNSRPAPFASTRERAPELDATIRTAPDSRATNVRTTPYVTAIERPTSGSDGWRRRRGWAVVGLFVLLAAAGGWALLRRWSNSTSAPAATIRPQITAAGTESHTDAGDSRGAVDADRDCSRALPSGGRTRSRAESEGEGREQGGVAPSSGEESGNCEGGHLDPEEPTDRAGSFHPVGRKHPVLRDGRTDGLRPRNGQGGPDRVFERSGRSGTSATTRCGSNSDRGFGQAVGAS